MVSLYGISNCDSCRKARKWLAGKGVEHEFIDIRESGLDPNLIDRWLKSVRWEDLVNRRSQTWRKIPESQREGLDTTGNRQLMLENPTLIKRPIVTRNALVSVGYDEAAWTHTFLTGQS